MRKISLNKVPAYQFHSFQKHSDQIEHAVFTKAGGVSENAYNSLNVRFGIGDSEKNVIQNRKVVCEALKIEGGNLISANQSHGKNVEIVDEEFIKFHPENHEVDYTDALITNLREVALMIQVADCQAIIMFDPVQKVIAAIHAGWKGLSKNISFHTVKLMQQEFGVSTKNLLVGISPSLGPCCSMFSDPKKELPHNFLTYIDDENKVDLWKYSMDQLQELGIPKKNIELAQKCTQCEGSSKFFSFRGGHGITGRFGAAIYLR